MPCVIWMSLAALYLPGVYITSTAVQSLGQQTIQVKMPHLVWYLLCACWEGPP